ncbi:MAG: hypothetical protein V4608_06875 [Bacteroidota bacterium]
MTQEKTDLQLITTPLRNLRQSAMNLDGFVLFINFRWFADMRDDFSWVYGISEVEINDFARQYGDTKDGIKTLLNNTENEKLRTKLKFEFESLPTLDPKEFTVDLDKPYWILSMLRPIKTIRKSIKFKDILNEINLTYERMVNYIENVEWLELQK